MSRTTDDNGTDIPEGSIFAPSYRVGSKHGADRCLVDSQAFTHPTDPDEAARIARERRLETEAVGLFWDDRVVVIPPKGIANVKALVSQSVGGHTESAVVLFIDGPTFDDARLSQREFWFPKPEEG